MPASRERVRDSPHHNKSSFVAISSWSDQANTARSPISAAFAPFSWSAPAFPRCLLDTIDADGAVPIATLFLAFRDFYRDRVARGLPAESSRARMARVSDLTEAEIQRLILDMPFRKFAQREFLNYGRDGSRVRFAPSLWKRLTDEDRRRLLDTTDHVLKRYFSASPAGSGDQQTVTGTPPATATPSFPLSQLSQALYPLVYPSD